LQSARERGIIFPVTHNNQEGAKGMIGRFFASLFSRSEAESLPEGTLPERTESALMAGGSIGRHLPGFAARPGQILLARAWAESIEGNGILAAEAATGIGKTLAYLVPAVLSGKRVVVATGTKTLQDQIAGKDVPLLRKALRTPFTCAVLKGRSNYVCLKRAGKTLHRREARPEIAAHLPAFQAFLAQTRTGDLSECQGVPEGAMIWQDVTSKGEDCQGRDCTHHGSCHLQNARRKAENADIVIVNHHLLFSALSAKEKSDGESDLLPGYDVLVVDEAHGIEDVAGESFGDSVSSRNASEILYGFRGIYALGDRIRNAALAFKEASDALFAALPVRQGRAGVPDKVLHGEIDNTANALARFADTVDRVNHHNHSRSADAEATLKLCDNFSESLSAIRDARPGEKVVWCERAGRTAVLRSTPIDVSGLLRHHLFSGEGAVLLTSATLSVAGNLSFFKTRVGIAKDPRAKDLMLASEFDHARRTAFYVPCGMPDPREATFIEAAARHAGEALAVTGGGGLVLCASHRSMKAISEHLRENTTFRVLVQGEMSRTKLLSEFTADRDSVLVATASFREGVDVPGASLRCVIVDKIPFSPPDDPVSAARADAIKKHGGDAFTQYHLPAAVIALRQGVGRLLRRHDDYGAVVILDPRVFSKPYGETVRKSLPCAPWERKLAEIAELYRRVEPKIRPV